MTDRPRTAEDHFAIEIAFNVLDDQSQRELVALMLRLREGGRDAFRAILQDRYFLDSLRPQSRAIVERIMTEFHSRVVHDASESPQKDSE